jgi:hypothetical protein
LQGRLLPGPAQPGRSGPAQRQRQSPGCLTRWVRALPQGDEYDYGCVLGASYLFYEAQRSGKLSGTSTRIKWRGDSSLKDMAPNNHDLVRCAALR